MTTYELFETITRPFGDHSRAFLKSSNMLFDTLWDFRQMLDPPARSYFKTIHEWAVAYVFHRGRVVAKNTEPVRKDNNFIDSRL